MDFTQPILVVTAHPDDETFALGGTVALAAQAEATVTVISATRGEKGALNLAQPLSSDELGSLRTRELTEALALLGAQKPIVWNYGDGRLDEANAEEIIAKILQVIDDCMPHSIITFGPDGGTGHRDHVAIHKLATEAFRRASVKENGPKELYWIARPAASREAFLQQRATRKQTQGHYHYDIPAVPYTDAELERVDIGPVLELKIAAANKHASQNPARFVERVRTQPEDFWRYEYFFRVPARLINK
jgi:LmbE family N-acetylglucosaminyl deacetylase